MQKSKKKLILKIFAVILAVIIVFAGLFGGYLLYRFNCDKSNAQNSYEQVYNAKQVNLQTDENGIFRVLKINDTHMLNGTCENDVKTLDGIKLVLEKTPCDFLVADGDIVEGFNLSPSYDKYQALDLLATLIEEYDIMWTFAPGNNDGEIDGSNEDIIAFLMQYDHFVYGNEKGIDGSMQFFADIYNGDKLVHSIAVIDSGAREPKAIGSYQPIAENQAQWLCDEANERKVKTSVFFHMQSNAFQEAYDNGTAYEGFKMYNTYPFDEIKGGYVFDDIIDSNDYISLISCGHQHSNNMCSFYDGRYYQLSSTSGYNASHDDFITPSCTLIAIDTNNQNTQTMYFFEQIEY